MAKKPTVQIGHGTYTVLTDLPPAAISQISVEIFTRWVEFALGARNLEGKRLMDPSGRYAKSLQMKSAGPNEVAIIADPKEAPEANILEFGHGVIDLKPSLKAGKAYPMHRPFGKYSPKRRTGWIVPPMPAYHPGLTLALQAARMASQMDAQGFKSRGWSIRAVRGVGGSMWAEKRAEQFTGFATFGGE